MDNKFYITTAIAYTSRKPHIGNTYELVLTDAIARYRRLKNEDVYFLTGTDEHGQKIEEYAKEMGVEPQVFVDKVADEVKDRDFYQKFTDTSILLFRLEVSSNTYKNVSTYLHEFSNRDIKYRYNYIGAILSRVNISVPRKRKYFCSEFVATVIKENNVRTLPKGPHVCMPYDFLQFDDIELIYEGLLKDYKNINITK